MLHETHAAIVFLSGDRAWKLKRAVRYDYLDFSTVCRRRSMLERELELNRRTTTDLYLAVRPINLADDGTLAIDGDGVAVDWLLEMRRLPDSAMLDQIVDRDRLNDSLAIRIADGLVTFHATLAPVRISDPVNAMRRIIVGNRVSMEHFPNVLDPVNVAAVSLDSEVLLEESSSLIRGRAEEGRVRHGHGDLHLGNIAVIDGVPTPFDCLEFDDAMATSDVLHDLAFLLMDLWRRGQHRQANIILNRYLDRSIEDENGLALLPLFLATRAAVRAHVEASQSKQMGDVPSSNARMYLALSTDLLRSCAARIVVIGGRSGTGKSTLAKALACQIGPVPGARIVSSDVLRKRLAGLLPEQRLPEASYNADSGQAVYDEMFKVGICAVRQGHSVVLDATFVNAEDRSRTLGLPEFGGEVDRLWLRGADDLRITRVEHRWNDASDVAAGAAKRQQEPDDVQLEGWQIMLADGDAASIAQLARKSVWDSTERLRSPLGDLALPIQHRLAIDLPCDLPGERNPKVALNAKV